MDDFGVHSSEMLAATQDSEWWGRWGEDLNPHPFDNSPVPLGAVPVLTPKERAKRFLDDLWYAKWDVRLPRKENVAWNNKALMKTVRRARLRVKYPDREELAEDLAVLFKAHMAQKGKDGKPRTQRRAIADLGALNDGLVLCRLTFAEWLLGLRPATLWSTAGAVWTDLKRRLGERFVR